MSDAYRISPNFAGALPTLNDPVLVIMLSGWIDTSNAAATAMEALVAETGATTLIEFDADTFIDYRARRPIMELRAGVNTTIDWSLPKMLLGRDESDRDILLLSGPEPDTRWQHFAATVAALADQLKVKSAYGLGAYPVATPHTRAVYISCTTPSAEAAARVPFLKSTLDVPAGVEAVLEHALDNRGITAIGLWAQVPHYVASMAYPAASVALIDALCSTSGLAIDVSSLREQSTTQRERLNGLVMANAEHAAMLAKLEEAFDAQHAASDPAATGIGGISLPSGEEIAAELEQFLREHNTDS
jgi:proteasome assembly chaperone (PAC2) family protein